MRLSSAIRARFIAESSHELRTPLTVLRGELELALRKERTAQEYKEALSIALESTLQLQALSEHLLEISRTERQAAYIQTFDLQKTDRKSTRLNSSHVAISYAVFCLKKKKDKKTPQHIQTSRDASR